MLKGKEYFNPGCPAYPFFQSKQPTDAALIDWEKVKQDAWDARKDLRDDCCALLNTTLNCTLPKGHPRYHIAQGSFGRENDSFVMSVWGDGIPEIMSAEERRSKGCRRA